MTGTALPRGNIKDSNLYSITLTPVSVAANTTAEQTFTVTGFATTDMIMVQKPTAQAGLGIVIARVSAANTLAITYINATGSAITPTAAEAYQVYKCGSFFNPLQTAPLMFAS